MSGNRGGLPSGLPSTAAAAFGFFASQPPLDAHGKPQTQRRDSLSSAAGPSSALLAPSSSYTRSHAAPAALNMHPYSAASPPHPSPSLALLTAHNAREEAQERQRRNSEAQAAATAAAVATGDAAATRPSPYPLTNPHHPEFDAGFVPPAQPASAAKATRRAAAAAAAKGKGREKSTEEEEQDEEGDVGADGERKPGWKRRRVVVACDRCRQKKIRCKGLPNDRNVCNNCDGMGYACTFDVSPSRSRGKFEILEAKVTTLLSALRSVAPDLATQFDKGQLGGGPLPIPTASALAAGGEGSAAQAGEAGAAHERVDSGSIRDRTLNANTLHANAVMLPDVEDGRPRYFGRSSAVTDFHGLRSRPPSPGLRSRNTQSDARGSAENGDGMEVDANASAEKVGTVLIVGGAKRSVLPRPQISYPTNSRPWIKNLRRKNLCGIGRDDTDYGTDAWQQRYLFPEPELMEHLFDTYFGFLHPLMPILHRASMEKDIALGRAVDDVAFRGLVFTMLAIAARFTDDPRARANPDDPESAGDHWAAASRLYHQAYSATLINVQVLLLTCIFSPSSLGPGVGWTVLGVAIRVIIDIGAHQERAYAGLPQIEQELRRRCFWAAHTLDCCFAINMGRPQGLRLSDCKVNMPLTLSEDELTRAATGVITDNGEDRSIMLAFCHLTRLNFIGSDVITTLHAPGAEPQYSDMVALTGRLDEWEKTIPAISHKLPAALLRVGLEDVRMYIIKPFLQAKDQSDYLRKMLLPQCAAAARRCLEVIIALHRDVKEFFFTFLQAWVSSTTFLITVWHQEHPLRLADDVALIEGAMRIFDALDVRYCSALLLRAHRILCDIAQRMLPHLTYAGSESITKLIEGYRKRTTAFVVQGSSGVPIPQHSTLTPASPALKGAPEASSSASTSEGPSTDAPLAMSMGAWSHWNAAAQWNATRIFPPGWSASASASASGSAPLGAGTPNLQEHSGSASSATPGAQQDLQSPAPAPALQGGEAVWTPWVAGATPIAGAEDFAVGEGMSGADAIPEVEDLAWADYFTRFLSQLPEPSTPAPLNGAPPQQQQVEGTGTFY